MERALYPAGAEGPGSSIVETQSGRRSPCGKQAALVSNPASEVALLLKYFVSFVPCHCSINTPIVSYACDFVLEHIIVLY